MNTQPNMNLIDSVVLRKTSKKNEKPIITFEQFLAINNIGDFQIHQENLLLFMNYLISIGLNNGNNDPQIKQIIKGVHFYKEHLYNKIMSKQLNQKQRNNILKSIDLYLKYLAKVKNFDIELKESVLTFNFPTFDDLGCFPFRQYIEELCHRGHLCFKNHITEIKRFLLYLDPEILKNITTLRLSHIQEYERMIMNRVINEDILMVTAYSSLKIIRLFIKFLKRINMILFLYDVPEKFYPKPNRDNEYVQEQELEILINTIINTKTKSPYKYRNLCIILLLIETGCRPVELCQLRMEDVKVTENNISLYCKKSETRNLKINPFVMNFLAEYKKNERKNTFPKDPFFIQINETPLYTSIIGSFITNYNLLAFGEMRFTAKSLRHTYITNALDNRNSFKQVSKAVGHKKWSSTMWYLERNTERLLKNTMPYNPNVRRNRP